MTHESLCHWHILALFAYVAVAVTGSLLLLAGLVCYALRIKRGRIVRIFAAMDELIQAYIDDPDVASSVAKPQHHQELATDIAAAGGAGAAVASPQTKSQYRESLAALAAGGQAKHFLGRHLTVEQIDAMSDAEVERLYGRYQSRLGATMAKTLGVSLIKLYCAAVSMWLPIDDKEKLEEDLRSDPFIDNALSGVCCEIYHRFGALLAPATAALTTARHCVRETSRFEIGNDGRRDCQRHEASDGDRQDSANTGGVGDFAAGQGQRRSHDEASDDCHQTAEGP